MSIMNMEIHRLERPIDENLESQTERIAAQNFAMWNSALLSKKPKQVAEFYSSNATFLPTVSDEFKHGQEGAERYFEHFLEINPAGKVLENKIQSLGKDSYLHSGMYNFEVDNKDAESSDKRKIIEARFTFVWKKNPDGKWLIVHHHSSIKPKV